MAVLSLFIPFGSLASPETGITAANLVAIFIIVMFAAEETGRSMSHIPAIGILMIHAAKESRGTAADFSTPFIVMIDRTKEAGAAFAYFYDHGCHSDWWCRTNRDGW